MFAAVRRLTLASTVLRSGLALVAVATAAVLAPLPQPSAEAAVAQVEVEPASAKGMALLAPTGVGQTGVAADAGSQQAAPETRPAETPAPEGLLGTPAAAPAADEPVSDAAPAVADPSPVPPAPQPEPEPAPAPPPPPPVTPDERGAAALALLDHPWQQLGWTIDFEPGRPGYLGMAYVEERRIVVWVRPEQSIEHLASVVAHELGHAVDLTWGTPERRARWTQLRGLDASTPWFGCSQCTDFATPAGDFAEVFSYWQTGTDFQSRMAGYPSPEALEALLPLFMP